MDDDPTVLIDLKSVVDSYLFQGDDDTGDDLTEALDQEVHVEATELVSQWGNEDDGENQCYDEDEEVLHNNRIATKMQ